MLQVLYGTNITYILLLLVLIAYILKLKMHLRQMRDLQKVYEAIAASLARASNLDDVLSSIMKGAMKLTNTDMSSILMWDAQTETFTQAFKIDVDGVLEQYKSQARPFGGRSRLIIDECRPIAISDAQQIPDFNPWFIKQGYRASLGAPLLNRGKVIGVLFVRSRNPRQFSKQQINWIGALASQVAEAIDRTKQQKRLIEARMAVAQMGIGSATWRHAIEGHAITIQEELTHLQADYSSKRLDKINERITKINRLAKLIRDKPVTLPLPEDELKPIYVNKLLCERIKQLWKNKPYHTVHADIILADDVAVRTSPEAIRQIFDIFVDNAIEAMGHVNNPTLTIATQTKGTTLEIVFTDQGKGIPVDILPHLFYKRIKKPVEAKGLGMGLLIAQTIAQTYGGEIRVASTTPAGTSMVFSLPIEN